MSDGLKQRIKDLLKLDNKFRRAGDRSKYVPHQGARECERRRNQRGTS